MSTQRTRAIRDLTSPIGVSFIALSGVAVLNGLAMITFINNLRQFTAAADAAKNGCPISRLLNATITMDARLEG